VPSVMLGNSAVKHLQLAVDAKLLAVYVTKAFMSRLRHHLRAASS
jgi:hypothetical protein